jgi:Kef-type K+ transport system membrane component KefB
MISRLLSGGGDITYESILSLALFLAAQWYLARCFLAMKLPTIPIEIGVGLVFGPHGLDLISDFSHTYSPLQLLGFIGVGIVIFESGMHLNIKKVFNIDMGPHVVAVACLGTALPILLGMGFMTALGSDLYPNGLSAGFALAPTSVGISLTLLGRAKQLNSRCGQIIMSAAFLDDIFSIICLVVLINLSEGSLDHLTHVIVPLVSSFAFVGFGVIGSIYLPRYFPMLINDQGWIFTQLNVANRSLGMQDEIHLFWMLACYLLLSWVGDLVGSALLGAFVAGMLFSCVPRSHHIWEKQFKRITRWLLRIFFSCTVAFSIDVTALFTVEAFWKGLVIGIGPCLLAKIVAGAFVGEERWVVGIAMMARGEFAYLVAEEAHALEMINDTEFAVVVWALLWATVLTPVIFDKVIKKFIEDQFVKSDGARSSRIGGNKFSGQGSFLIHYFGAYQVGMVHDMTAALHEMGFDVKKSITESSGSFGMGTFEVYVRQAITLEEKYGADFMSNQRDTTGGTMDTDTLTDSTTTSNSRRSMKYKMATDLTDEKLDEVAKHLKETIKDADAQIIFEPSKKEGEEADASFVAIELFGVDHRTAIDSVTEMMVEDMAVALKGTLEHNESAKLGKTHYTSIYFSKLENVSPVKVVRGHISRSVSGRMVTTDDCSKYTTAIKDLLGVKNLSHCDVMVRVMHGDAVVYANDTGGGGSSRQNSSSNIKISADKRFSLSDINVSNCVNVDGSLKRFSMSDIDVSNAVNDDGTLKKKTGGDVQLALLEGDEDTEGDGLITV